MPVPEISAGSAGSATTAVATEPYVVGPPADIDLWVLWLRTPLDQLEVLRSLINDRDLGVVSNPEMANGIRELLKAAAKYAASTTDPAAIRVNARGTSQRVVHRFALRQR